jgi:prephenate dehydrogenase
VTRVASGDPSMWMDIFASNREFILQTSRQLRAVLSEMESCLEDGDTASLADKLTRARAGRARIPSVVRGFLRAGHSARPSRGDRRDRRHSGRTRDQHR